MSFMQPEIWEEEYYTVETNCGTETVPVDVCGILEDCGHLEDEAVCYDCLRDHFGDYIEGRKVYSAELSFGWLYRLSAPGYMDCTETGHADSEAEAIAELLELYGNECGEPEDWEQELKDRLTELSQ